MPTTLASRIAGATRTTCAILVALIVAGLLTTLLLTGQNTPNATTSGGGAGNGNTVTAADVQNIAHSTTKKKKKKKAKKKNARSIKSKSGKTLRGHRPGTRKSVSSPRRATAPTIRARGKYTKPLGEVYNHR